VALVADALGDIPAADLNADASPLAVAMAFANVSGVPASISDGIDNGTVDTLSGLTIDGGGTLNVATGGVTDIATGTLTGAQLQDGTVTSTQLGALSTTKVADGTLTGANFANGAFATTADVTGTALVFKNPAGCANPFALSSASTPACARLSCGTDQLRACSTGTCENVGPNPSASTRICVGTSEGFELVGRLIKNP